MKIARLNQSLLYLLRSFWSDVHPRHPPAADHPNAPAGAGAADYARVAPKGVGGGTPPPHDAFSILNRAKLPDRRAAMLNIPLSRADSLAGMGRSIGWEKVENEKGNHKTAASQVTR